VGTYGDRARHLGTKVEKKGEKEHITRGGRGRKGEEPAVYAQFITTG